MKARIVVADDEPAIVMAVRDELLFEGFEVHTAASGPDAVRALAAVSPELLILDLMLPGLNGLEVCRQARSQSQALWIILLTVRGSEADRVHGFGAGADDYVVKPFSLRELVSRVHVGLRRVHGATGTVMTCPGGIEIDLGARRVSRLGVEISLTRTEFDILACLVRSAGQVVTRDTFLDLVWGRDVFVTHRTIDTHVASLRRKIELDPQRPVIVQGVRGVGYRCGAISTKP